MKMLRAIAPLVLFLAILPVQAQTPDPKSQEFQLQDVASLSDLPPGQLKPKTIAFSDRPPASALDAGTGFMRFENWGKVRPIEQQFLSLYPGYTEPNTDKTQITVFAVSLIKDKSVFSYRFSVYRNAQTTDEVLRKIKVDVAALVAANR